MNLAHKFWIACLVGFTSLLSAGAAPFNVYLISSDTLYSYSIDPTTNPPTVSSTPNSSGAVFTSAVGLAVSVGENYVYVLDNAATPVLKAYNASPQGGLSTLSYSYSGVMSNSAWNQYINPIAVHPSNKFVYIPDYNNFVVNVFNTSTRTLSTNVFSSFVDPNSGTTFTLNNPVSVSVSATGEYLAIGCANIFSSIGPVFQFPIDPSTGVRPANPPATYNFENTNVLAQSCTYNGDGSTIAIVTYDGTGVNGYGASVTFTNGAYSGGTDTLPALAVTFAPSSSIRIFVPSTNSANVLKIDATGLSNSSLLSTPAIVKNLAFSPDGLTLCGVDPTNSKLYIWTNFSGDLSSPAKTVNLTFTPVNLATASLPLSVPLVGKNPAPARH